MITPDNVTPVITGYVPD